MPSPRDAARVAPDPSRERLVRWSDPRALAERARASSGLEFLTAMTDRRIPIPPVAALLGFALVEVSEGRAVFEYEPHESHYNPIGTVHGGVISSVFDAALGCAIHTKLPPGVAYTTIEAKTTFLRPVLSTTGKLRCEAKALHVGRSVGASEATLVDAAGKLYAHATSTCLVMRP